MSANTPTRPQPQPRSTEKRRHGIRRRTSTKLATLQIPHYEEGPHPLDALTYIQDMLSTDELK
jgi:hypothetical protein